MLRGRRFCPTALVALVLSATAFAQGPSSANYDESKVGDYRLPDPLVFDDGKPVRTAHEWMEFRRAEILNLFATNVYGRTPTPPKSLRYQVFDEDHHALGGKAIRKQVSIYFSPREDVHKEDLLLYLPAGARKPVPVILSLNFGGNQSVSHDPAVKLPTLWDRKTHAGQQASEETRGSDTGLNVEKTLAQGYGFATIYYQDIEPDFQGGYEYGIRPLFLKPGQAAPAPDEWGAIGAWAWGLSRAMDYLEKDRDIDSKRVAVIGHSRLGKTALWAGAQDARFSMVISNDSGEGGAAISRRNFGERIRNLNTSFPHWFCANFKKYNDREDQLPLDSHTLLALIAPRPLYVASAQEDQWADPKGEFLGAANASAVYELFGKQGIGTDQMPGIHQPILHTVAYHIRAGKHDITAYDWEQYLKFAGMQWISK